MEKYLLDCLNDYTSSDAYPLHMPGHKRQISHFSDPFAIDITEIEGFDNLHHAEGILLEAQERAARLYGADETWYLVNGSTCGILAAVSASVRRGGRILMARNCHKAAYHAAFLNGLQVTWLYPEIDRSTGICGSISPGQVSKVLEMLRRGDAAGMGQSGRDSSSGCCACQYHSAGRDGCGSAQSPAAVLITSPTYDGVVSDIRAIAQEVHRAGAILIVDEAHGAHFAMHPYFPESALSCGADIVINSLHKTMPSLTQTALLHVKGPRVDRERLRKYLDIYQSSSPSYVLMAGMDECIRMMETQGRELFDVFVGRLEALRGKLKKMKVLRLVTGDEPGIQAFAYDASKIIIAIPDITAPSPTFHASRISGPVLGRILRERYHLEPEMEAKHYVTAIMTVADTQEGFDRLERALLEIDGWLSEILSGEKIAAERSFSTDAALVEMMREEAAADHLFSIGAVPIEMMTMEEADRYPHESVSLKACAGRTAAEFAYLYPPGIPLLVPGERIPDGFAELVRRYQEMGLKLQGLADYRAEMIECVMDGYGSGTRS